MSYLYPHQHGWKYKRRCPRDLQAALGIQHWIVTYPQTVSRADAKLAAAQLSVEHDRLIGALRKLSPADREQLLDLGGVAGLPQTIACGTENYEVMASRPDRLRDAFNAMLIRHGVSEAELALNAIKAREAANTLLLPGLQKARALQDALQCQTAGDVDPRSASKRDPSIG